MEINFYQSEEVIYKAIAPILIKILDQEKKAYIFTKDENIKEIDDGLWSFSKTKFVPHATTFDNLKITEQPIFIGSKLENINNANYLIKTTPAEEEFCKKFERICYFFNSENLKEARDLWKKYQSQNFELNFYKKDKSNWHKINL